MKSKHFIVPMIYMHETPYICPLLFDLSGSVQTRDCLSNNFYNKNSKLGRGEERGGEVVRIKLTVFTEY